MDHTKPTDLSETAEASSAALERQSQVRHDLRAPLAVMYPLLSMMLEGGDFTERQREHLEMLERNVRRIDGMISSVAASGWFDCCAAPLVLQPVPLDDLARGLAATRRLGGDDGPLLDVRLAAGASAAWADRDRVTQIVTDLVDNAARFAPRPGVVTLVVEPGSSAATVVLRVADTGPGISADELPHVTEFGFRGSAARELGVPGLGLGLWVCCRLAEEMGGGLVVESAVGSGTTVTVTLPAAE